MFRINVVKVNDSVKNLEIKVKHLGTDFDDVSKPMAMVIPGFLGTVNSTTTMTIREAVLYKYDWNVLVVDWSSLCPDCMYDDTSREVYRVARAVARFINKLFSLPNVDPKALTMIGMDLGVHVAGVAAQKVTYHTIEKIIALDPALANFTMKPLNARLDAGDAKTVLSIHTADVNVELRIRYRIGHFNFYPNGGQAPQPACLDEGWSNVCSHMMAVAYFVEAIYNNNAFCGIRCGNWTNYLANRCYYLWGCMGLDVTPDDIGNYFFYTSSTPPYGNIDSGNTVGFITVGDMMAEFYEKIISRYSDVIKELVF